MTNQIDKIKLRENFHKITHNFHYEITSILRFLRAQRKQLKKVSNNLKGSNQKNIISYFRKLADFNDIVKEIKDDNKIINENLPDLEEDHPSGFYFIKGRKVLASVELTEEESKIDILQGKLDDQQTFLSLGIKMGFVYMFSLIEALIKNLLNELFLEKKELLKNNTKKFTTEEIIESENYEQLIDYLIEKEINKLGYHNIDELNKYFLTKFNHSFEERFKNWEKLKKSYYQRNLIVHNSSIINQQYLDKTNDYLYYKKGDQLLISFRYFEIVYYVLHNFGTHLEEFFKNKFCKSE